MPDKHSFLDLRVASATFGSHEVPGVPLDTVLSISVSSAQGRRAKGGAVEEEQDAWRRRNGNSGSKFSLTRHSREE